MQESPKNQQWMIWVAIGAGVLIIGCVVCIGGTVLFGFLPLARFGVSAPVQQNLGNPNDPTNPDLALYLSEVETQLDDLERGSQKLGEAIEAAQQDPNSNWKEDAYIGENLIANGHDVLASITPPSSAASVHEEVMGAATLCYELNGFTYGDPDTAELKSGHELTEDCDARVEAARSALAAAYGTPSE